MKKFLIAIGIVLCATTAFALRVSRPLVLSHPITAEQVSQLNRFLEDVWNIQKGLFEFDVVTTSKANAKNGEIWFLQTGDVVRIQYKGAGHVFTITPDGY